MNLPIDTSRAELRGVLYELSDLLLDRSSRDEVLPVLRQARELAYRTDAWSTLVVLRNLEWDMFQAAGVDRGYYSNKLAALADLIAGGGDPPAADLGPD